MESSKVMKSEIGKETKIHLDNNILKYEIVKNGKYEEQNILIKKYESENNTVSYLGCLKNNDTVVYKGILNSKFKRNDLGINYYESGDIYFGTFDNDLKDGYGAYLFKPIIEKNCIYSEMYHGNWKENNKDSFGLYIWTREYTDKNNQSYETTDFEAFIGHLTNDNFKKGCYLTKVGKDYYYYYGGFDKNGKKSDNEAFFYDKDKDRVFIGKTFNDKFTSGYLSTFNKENNLNNFYYVEFDNNDIPTLLTKEDEIESDIKKYVLEKVIKFRNYLLGKEDHHLKIYNNFIGLKNFINIDLENIEALETQSVYNKAKYFGSSFNEMNIFTTLDKFL
jgi:hypothetical protein